ncbi:MAG: hypothetical protein ABSG64_06725 [Solirubrobacteraceae bacterium]
MRRAAAIAVVTLAALLGGGALAVGPVVAADQASPSGFTVQPNIADPACNGGQGLALPALLGTIPVVASTALSDGSTLIAVSSGGDPNENSVVLYSATATCAPNLAFGQAGVATLGPTQPAPKDPSPTGWLGGLQIDAVAPATGGGALLAGGYGDHWIVGEITAQGQPDPSFGTDGWSLLPYREEVESVVQEPSGQIVIGASKGSGCCVTNSMATLSSTGQLETAFGAGGRAGLPTGEDSGVATPVLEPNGDILAPIGYGNMGCWGMSLEMLAPSGQPVPLFRRRLSRFWQRLHLGAFEGDAYADGAGFTVIGTGQRPCYGFKSSRSATGLIAHFAADGQQIGRTIKFPSPMYGTVQAFPDGNDTLIAEAPYANATRLTIEALRPNGSLDPGFASNGVAQIRTPWRGTDAPLETMVSVSQAGPGTLVIVAQDGGTQLQLTRLDV